MTSNAKIKAHIDMLAKRLEEWLLQDGPVLSPQQFAAAIGIHPDAVTTMLADGSVWAMTSEFGDNRGPEFPAWLIRDGAVLPGIAETLAVLRQRGHNHCLAYLRFYCEPLAALEGKRVLDLLRDGEFGAAVKVAEDWK